MPTRREIKSLSLEDKLATLGFKKDQEPHIQVEAERCQKCSARPCLNVCPAQNYKWEETKGLVFNYESCLECGTCRLVCPEDAIKWQYPRGGFGVSFWWG